MSRPTFTPNHEREAKLSAGPDWALPGLAGTAGIDLVEEAPRQVLDAVYFDTADLRLIRNGITLRHRRDRSGAGERGWTLKLPSGGPGPGLSRHEFVWPGDLGAPPAEAVSLIRATIRTAPLAPVAQLHTDRHRYWLLASAGTGTRRIGEVDDDRVSLGDVADPEAAPDGVAFREVEVELATEAPDAALKEIVGRLESAGATASGALPKVVRALGPAARKPPISAAAPVESTSTIADVVAAFIAEAVTAVLRYDPALRLGGDVEDVHQARTAVRRLRSHLRTFRPVLDRGWLAGTEPNLRWIGRVLGTVRDADVLAEALAGEARTLSPVDAEGARDLLARLTREREAAEEALLAVLDSDAYIEVLDRLVAAIAAPPLRSGISGDAAASTILPALAARPWKRLRRQVEGLGDDPLDLQLHEVRKRAKHLRYAAELCTPVAGRPARRLAKAAQELQGVLGEQHDAVVLTDYLRRAADASTSRAATVAGELIAHSAGIAGEWRRAWPAAWHSVARKKHRAWLRGATLPKS